ncbi:MAG: hypothetical protein JNG84_13670 [Archangium sp.]|nr:hypothetical protein [Archangium sp.]
MIGALARDVGVEHRLARLEAEAERRRLLALRAFVSLSMLFILLVAIFVWPGVEALQESDPEPYHQNWLAQAIDRSEPELTPIGERVFVVGVVCWCVGLVLKAKTPSVVLLATGVLMMVAGIVALTDIACIAGYWTGPTGCAWE